MIWVVVALSVIIYFLILLIFKLLKDVPKDHPKGELNSSGSISKRFIIWVNLFLVSKGYNLNKIDKDLSLKTDEGIDPNNSVIIKKVYNNKRNINKSYICLTEIVQDGLDKPINVLDNAKTSILKAATLVEIIGKNKVTQTIDPNNIDQTLQAMSEGEDDEFTDEIGIHPFYI